MTRRLAAVLVTLAVLSVGCALPPTSDRSAADEPLMSRSGPALPAKDGLQILRSVGSTTVAPTTTIASTAAPAATDKVVLSNGKPDHLRSRGDDLAAKPEAIVASLAPDPPPATTAPTVKVAPTTTLPPFPTPPSPPVPTTTRPPATTTRPPVGDGSPLVQFATLINALRTEVGVATLSRSADLDARAQAWTEYMATTGDFQHSSIINDLVAGSWSIAGENIGYGQTVDAVFAALRASSGHYTNMVNPAFTTVGVGVVIDGDGVVWTTHLFSG